MRLVRVLPFLALVSIPLFAQSPAPGQKVRGNPPSQNAKFKQITAYGQLPMSFEPNVGQADNSIQFVARGEGYSLLLTPTGVQAILHAPPELLSGGQTQNGKQKARLARTPGQTASMRMNLLGAVNNAARAAGIDRMPGNVNSFRGSIRKFILGSILSITVISASWNTTLSLSRALIQNLSLWDLRQPTYQALKAATFR